MVLIGVIGEMMFFDMIVCIFIVCDVVSGMDDWFVVVKVIMMMDIYLKGVFVEIEIGGVFVKIVGIVKGLGMIVFDMVIMFVFIVMDVCIFFLIL